MAVGSDGQVVCSCTSIGGREICSCAGMAGGTWVQHIEWMMPTMTCTLAHARASRVQAEAHCLQQPKPWPQDELR